MPNYMQRPQRFSTNQFIQPAKYPKRKNGGVIRWRDPGRVLTGGEGHQAPGGRMSSPATRLGLLYFGA
jgi:hypothetical protein